MLKLNIDNFSINNKNVFTNENGDIQYWSQPDFSYKNRVHVYDQNDNEIGYVQYKILSSQTGNEYYYPNDTRINMDDYSLRNVVDEWNYEIVKNDVVIFSIKKDGNNVIIDSADDLCLLLVYGNIS